MALCKTPTLPFLPRSLQLCRLCLHARLFLLLNPIMLSDTSSKECTAINVAQIHMQLMDGPFKSHFQCCSIGSWYPEIIRCHYARTDDHMGTWMLLMFANTLSQQFAISRIWSAPEMRSLHACAAQHFARVSLIASHAIS